MYKIPLIASGLFAPSLAFAATPQTFADLVTIIIGLINPLAALLAGVAILIFFWGIIKYIFSAGGEGHQQGRNLIMWGVVALFVLFSVWGLARLVSSLFLGGSAPTSSVQGLSATANR